MNRLKNTVNVLFTRHLFATNVASGCGLLSLGDFIIQNIERRYVKKTQGRTVNYNYERTGRMFVIGVILGPFNHFWYRFLDRAVTGKGVKMVAKKVAADQAVAGPFFCSSFLLGMGLLEGKSLGACGQEWREKFPTIYMADWCIWPPAQIINFYFLPPQYRVVYVAFVTLCWNTFLSFMKHKDMLHAHDEISEKSS
ncbi:hypothetical protein BaRGS_00012828 [Batillaria attramentaria]|uniref:Mpv17-like protein 2 n=1 Tax=Batillaria attramentaria TaxID=370345 RepID=A0ABD0L9H6_9CAEN